MSERILRRRPAARKFKQKPAAVCGAFQRWVLAHHELVGIMAARGEFVAAIRGRPRWFRVTRDEHGRVVASVWCDSPNDADERAAA